MDHVEPELALTGLRPHPKAMTTITLDDIIQTMDEPVSDLPLKTRIDAFFDGTKHMHDFGREVMIPQLKALLGPTAQEIALRDTYFKMHLLLGSAVTMNRLEHFQSVAALTRSLFELHLDMKIIATDKTGDAVGRYNEFPEIERYRRAKQLLAFDAAHPGQIKQDLSAQRAFVSEPARQARVAAAIGAKKRYPAHWSGMDTPDRARRMGQEALYVEVYALLSWFVHAGAAGTAGMGKEALESVFAVCHGVIRRIFLDAIEVCAKATKISELVEYPGWMRSLETKTAELIVSEQRKLLDAKRAQSAAP
jgi:hypothetical protein